MVTQSFYKVSTGDLKAGATVKTYVEKVEDRVSLTIDVYSASSEGQFSMQTVNVSLPPVLWQNIITKVQEELKNADKH